jgi:hypothetical protein
MPVSRSLGKPNDQQPNQQPVHCRQMAAPATVIPAEYPPDANQRSMTATTRKRAMGSDDTR